MSKKEAYYNLVKWQHVYTYGECLNDFLDESIEQIRANGYNAPACTIEIHDAIERAVRRSLPKKE